MNAKSAEIQDVLRLSPRQTAEALQGLDQRAHSEVTEERRKTPRLPYQQFTRLNVLLENEHKGRRTYGLAPRNLSRTGISLLHGKFIYGGTNCVAGLRTLDGQIAPVHGKVIWCRLITGGVHELGVQFDEPVAIEEFVE